MTKVDALRALREAKYARASSPSAPVARPVVRPQTRTTTSITPDPGPTASADTCGHRNMSGRMCTREADHVKAGTKNHRYA